MPLFCAVLQFIVGIKKRENISSRTAMRIQTVRKYTVAWWFQFINGVVECYMAKQKGFSCKFNQFFYRTTRKSYGISSIYILYSTYFSLLCSPSAVVPKKLQSYQSYHSKFTRTTPISPCLRHYHA